MIARDIPRQASKLSTLLEIFGLFCSYNFIYIKLLNKTRNFTVCSSGSKASLIGEYCLFAKYRVYIYLYDKT